MNIFVRSVACSLFGEEFNWIYPTYRDLPCDEPIPFQDIEISRDGRVLFIYRRQHQELKLGAEGNPQAKPDLWAQGWDRLGIPHNMTLTGIQGFRVFKWLCAYRVAGPGGDVDQWHEALSSGRVGWRALELSRPDLVTVPLLRQWKEEQLSQGKKINIRGRPLGARSESVPDQLDRHAYEVREVSRLYGPPMSWGKAVDWALKYAPPEIAWTVDREAMIARLQKGKAKEKWLKFQSAAGKPPPS